MRAHLWDYLGGRECKQTWRKAKWNVLAGLKQLKLKEDDVPGVILP